MKIVVIGAGAVGFQLARIITRREHDLTLVELDQELADWIMPVIRPHLRKKTEVIIGDAYEVMPKLKGKADGKLVSRILDARKP